MKKIILVFAVCFIFVSGCTTHITVVRVNSPDVDTTEDNSSWLMAIASVFGYGPEKEVAVKALDSVLSDKNQPVEADVNSPDSDDTDTGKDDVVIIADKISTNYHHAAKAGHTGMYRNGPVIVMCKNTPKCEAFEMNGDRLKENKEGDKGRQMFYGLDWGDTEWPPKAFCWINDIRIPFDLTNYEGKCN